MSQQDNRGTAFPYYYTIRDRVRRFAPLDRCDEVVWEYDGHEFATEEEARRELKDGFGIDDHQLEKEYRKIKEVGIKIGWKDHGIFLTEKDAEAHLLMNAHHYSAEAHTYVDHAWRAPQLEHFLIALFNHFGIKPPPR